MPITNFPPDLLIITQTNNYANAGRPRFHTKLITNGDTYLASSSTASETTETAYNNPRFTNTGYDITASSQTGGAYVGYALKRAPGFMDVVCYTGDNSVSRNLNHNLEVIPELIIVKCRNSTTDGHSTFPAGWWTAVKGSSTNGFWFLPPSSGGGGLNSSGAAGYTDSWSAYFSSSTTFNPFNVTLSSGGGIAGNVTGQTYVAYLFATLAGVSKVGSYTGNGSSQTINCGFAAGARFILIKRTDAAGDWYVWDTTRGIAAANDPHLSLNSIAAQVTTDDSIDAASTGFIVNQVAATNINVTSATYIYLAIS